MNNKSVDETDAKLHQDGGDDAPKFSEPKLTFLKPELEKQGSLENLTKQGFFGVFPGQGS